ncbi:MAG: hypothetical protein WCY10_00915 [Candidatus Omnitrophota bacterium]
MMIAQQNKRLFPRVKIKGPVSYQIRGTHDINYMQTDDICVGGLGFTNNRFIAPSTAVNLEINIASRILRPIGIVTRSTPASHSDKFRTGLTFVEFEPAEKKYLSDFITMRLNHE